MTSLPVWEHVDAHADQPHLQLDRLARVRERHHEALAGRVGGVGRAGEREQRGEGEQEAVDAHMRRGSLVCESRQR